MPEGENEQTITAALLANAAAGFPRSPMEIAGALGVARSSVYQRSSRLRRAGKLPVSARQVTRAIAAVKSEETNGTMIALDAKVLADVLGDVVVLDADERRRVLSHLARAAPAPVQVSAIRALEEMDRQSGRQVGPPEPVTDEELTERGGRILYALGPEIGGAAIEQALARWKADEMPLIGSNGTAATAAPEEITEHPAQ